MRLRRGFRRWILSGAALGGLVAIAQAQSGVTDAMLARKKAFADQQRKASAEPFVGLRPTAGSTPGLYPIRASGVSTAPIVQAAQAWLATLTPAQTLRNVGNLRDDHAAVHLRDVATHLGDTWFAWAGSVSDEAVFYYRIHSPVILIEFDHQLPVGTTSVFRRGRLTRAHIPTTVRTPNGNDCGKDLLRQHLAQHPLGDSPLSRRGQPSLAGIATRLAWARKGSDPGYDAGNFSTRLTTGFTERK